MIEKARNNPRKIVGALAVGLLGIGLMLPTQKIYPQGVLIPQGIGEIDQNITQANIQKTICVKGYSSKVRPAEGYTQSVRKHLKAKPTDILDHAISIELGGQAQSLNNLWLEPKHITYRGEDLGSLSKDQVENYLHQEVCHNNINLTEAQANLKVWPEIYLKIKGKLGSADITSDD